MYQVRLCVCVCVCARRAQMWHPQSIACAHIVCVYTAFQDSTRAHAYHCACCLFCLAISLPDDGAPAKQPPQEQTHNYFQRAYAFQTEKIDAVCVCVCVCLCLWCVKHNGEKTETSRSHYIRDVKMVILHHFTLLSPRSCIKYQT